MNADLLKQAIGLFDTYEKWSAFLELHKTKQQIKNQNFNQLKAALHNKPSTWQWSFSPIGNGDRYRWYLTDFTKESICLVWDCTSLTLWCHPSFYNAHKVKELLATPQYEIIKDCFDYIDALSQPATEHFIVERHRYDFQNGLQFYAEDDQNSNNDRLSWFAGNMTTEIADMITSKVQKFQTPEITELLMSLNQECKTSK